MTIKTLGMTIKTLGMTIKTLGMTNKMSKSKKQIFCWHGDNDFAINQQIRRWLDLFDEKFGNINIVHFDGEENISEDEMSRRVKNALQVDSLFGANKFVIFRNFLPPAKNAKQFKVKSEALGQVINGLKNLSETFFIIFWQKNAPEKKTSLYKAIVQKKDEGIAEIKEFKMLREHEIVDWIVEQTQKMEGVIGRPVAADLHGLVGNDLWYLNNEIFKLVNYCEGREILKEDVDELVRASSSEDIFKLMDAISAKNKQRVLQLFQKQLDEGAEEMYLFFMIVRQFRLLLQMKYLLEDKNIHSADQAGQILKIHPFVAKKTFAQAKNFSLEQLKDIYNKLVGIDQFMKTKNIDFELMFDLVVSEL